jgi:hypothetical protein
MDQPDQEPGDQTTEPASLRFLRRLVTVLTIVMVGGVVAILFLLVMRFRDVPPNLPEEITLPAGAKATGFSQGTQWFAVTTDQDEILIFDRVTGRLTQRIKVVPAD